MELGFAESTCDGCTRTIHHLNMYVTYIHTYVYTYVSPYLASCRAAWMAEWMTKPARFTV